MGYLPSITCFVSRVKCKKFLIVRATAKKIYIYPRSKIHSFYYPWYIIQPQEYMSLLSMPNNKVYYHRRYLNNKRLQIFLSWFGRRTRFELTKETLYTVYIKAHSFVTVNRSSNLLDLNIKHERYTS